MQNYRTIASEAKAEINEKKSRFIAFATPAETEEEVANFIAEIKKLHPGANHCVFAYALHTGARTRCTDDGEPAKTAGPPVLECITAMGLTNILVVVVRYFGGTLLGTGGLQRAYGAAARAALQAATFAQVRICVRHTFALPYNLRDQAVKLLEGAGAQNLQTTYTDKVNISFTLPQGEENELYVALQNLMRGGEICQSEPFYMPFEEK